VARLTIVRLGDSVLRREAREVDAVDDAVRSLVEDMFETMYASEGQGLAAPQVGVSRRIAVVDVPPRSRASPRVLINPRIAAASDATSRGPEGCLSVPGVREKVTRPAQVVVEALDLEGACVRIEADGELARCLQHEIDHLDGVLYVDRVAPLARRILLQRYRRRLGAAAP
jgi:peptide deformylase